jgi:hypothetical protein
MARALKADEKLRPRIKRRKCSWRSGIFDKGQKHERISRFFDQFLCYVVYANLIACFTMESIVWNVLGAFAASCQIILYYRLMTQVVECGTSVFHHSFY